MRLSAALIAASLALPASAFAQGLQGGAAGGAQQAAAGGQVATSGATSPFTTSPTAGSFTVLANADAGRKYLRVYYYGARTIYIFFGSGTPSIAGSIQINAANNNPFDAGQLVIEQGQIQIASNAPSETVVVAKGN